MEFEQFPKQRINSTPAYKEKIIEVTLFLQILSIPNVW